MTSINEDLDLIRPQWPAPRQVQAASTTRLGGVSSSPFNALNLAHHVDDDLDDVGENRQRLQQALSLPMQPLWLDQVHGIEMVAAGEQGVCQADGCWTTQVGKVCAVMTADCLPLLVCDREGSVAAAIHAGWRGLLAGVIEAGIRPLQRPAEDLLVWLGPAIGPQAFEVGDEVYRAFVQNDAQAKVAFQSTRPGHWLADLYLLARQRLAQIGVEAVYGGDYCTFSDPDRFFSYRRDGQTGRMASLIWLQD